MNERDLVFEALRRYRESLSYDPELAAGRRTKTVNRREKQRRRRARRREAQAQNGGQQ